MSPFSKLKILLETRSKASRERTKVRKMKAKAEKAKSRTLAATDIAYDITTPVDDPRKLAARKYRKRHEKRWDKFGGENLGVAMAKRDHEEFLQKHPNMRPLYGSKNEREKAKAKARRDANRAARER